MPFFSGFPMYGAGGGLFSSFNQNMPQPNTYGNPFPTPSQNNMGLGYAPPYLMQYMQQFGMPMQQSSMPMQQPDMNYLGKQAAEQYMQQFGGLARVGQPTVPGGQGFPPPQQMGGPIAEPQPFYPINQYPPQMGTAPSGASNAASVQQPMLSIPPEQLAQLRALTGAPAQTNMVQSSRATILPPTPPISVASSPIRTRMAAPVNTANMGGVRNATGVSLADALKMSRARIR